jgi:hypothetical protein
MTCSTCKGTCPVPLSCGQPLADPAPAPARRWRMYRPTFTLSGPYRKRRRRSWSMTSFYVLGIAYLLLMAWAVVTHLSRSLPPH